MLHLGVFTYRGGPFVSPILVRPVREQLEHDRIIRLLQVKCRRRYDVGMNPGVEQNAPIGTGPSVLYPDLVLLSQQRGRRLHTVVEVETGESVNHLEALAQWAHYGKLRADFHLYVPSGMVDVARRLCEDNRIRVNEIWSFHTVGDEVRFTLVHRSRDSAPEGRSRAASAATKRKPAPVAKRTARGAPSAARAKAKKRAAGSGPERQKRK